MKTPEELKIETPVFSIGLALSEGWDYVKKFIPYYILAGFITMAIVVITSFIPIIGGVANNVVLSPCLMAGAVYVTWQISLGKGWVDLGDMFKGFQYLQPLAVSSLIQGTVTLILTVLIFYNFLPELSAFFKLSQTADAFTNQQQIRTAFLQLFTSKFIVSLTIWMVSILFVSVIWVFKTHFIVIYKMQAWPAMEMSRHLARHNFFQLIGFFLVMGTIIIASALPCGIGLLFSLPLMIGSAYSAFAQITQCDKSGELNEETFDFMADKKDN